MTYVRFRTRNGLKRSVPLGDPPYGETVMPYVEALSIGTPARVTAERDNYLKGELNRFENDVLGLSCWCPHRSGCSECEHGVDMHPVDRRGTPWSWECVHRDCTCKKWTPYGAVHTGNEICPNNHYAEQLAKHVNSRRTVAEGVALHEEDVRAVMRAMMEVY
jgi:hypothetical protein